MKWDWWEKRDLGLVSMVRVGATRFTEREERESMLIEDNEMLFVFSKTKLTGVGYLALMGFVVHAWFLGFLYYGITL